MPVKIVDGRRIEEAVELLLQGDRNVVVGTIEAVVSFTSVFADTPNVMTTPGLATAYARVLSVQPDSFSWQSDAAGSAHWMAYGSRW